ncbi:40083_t:CDS:2 [Gigaspora margarita]|uniref:40083_t:CDS:1 n=1 Tax=Gigaspora margarita TaxID=4874 RepID=A0ABN7V5J3_GIGMA|nr:40083_t:CDS:2 [Gigaspora margarita]
MFLSIGKSRKTSESKKPNDMGKKKSNSSTPNPSTSKKSLTSKSKKKLKSASDNSSVTSATSEAMNDISSPSIIDEKIASEPSKPLITESHMNENLQAGNNHHVIQQSDSLNGPRHSIESKVNANTVIPFNHERNINKRPPSESGTSGTEESGENLLSDTTTAPTEEERGLREEGWGGFLNSYSPDTSKNNLTDFFDASKNNLNYSPKAFRLTPKDESIATDRNDEVDLELQKNLHANYANEDAATISRSSRNIDESDSPLVGQGSNTSVAIVPRGLPRELFSDNLYIGSIEQLPPIGLAFYWLGWYTEAVFTRIADNLNIVDRYTGIPLSKLFLWLYSPKNWLGINNEDLTKLEAARTVKLE